MTITYEFGGDDLHPGEEYEYEVDKEEAFKDILDNLIGHDKARLLAGDMGYYIDYEGYILDNKDVVKDFYETEAYEQWRENK